MIPARARGIAVDLALALVAAAFWVFHPSQAFLDGAYGSSFYPKLQHAMTTASNVLPFAAGDVLLLAVVISIVVTWFRFFRRRSSLGAAAAATRTVAIASVLYVWFLVAWGWNYLRPPLYQTLGFDPAAVKRVSLDELESRMVVALNAAAPLAHARNGLDASPVVPLRAAFSLTLPQMHVASRVVETHPKRTLLDPYFVATGVSGMFFPYTFETYLASDVLWFEYPFDLTHEWGHLGGIARESDANFVGAVGTLESEDPILRYSGLLIVYGAMPRLKQYDARLSKLVLADYAAMRQRDERHIKPIAFKFAWNTYDKYLKAQHVASGVVNYTEYVQLLLGTPLGRQALARATGARLSLRPAP